MSDEFHLDFDDAAAASRAMGSLSSLSVDGKPALTVTRNGARLVCGCAVISQVPEDTMLEAGAAGSRVRFLDLFYQAGGLKSGMHHPDGMLWIRLPDRSHSVSRDKVPLTAVAPTILRLMGMTPPASMKTDAILNPRLEPARELVAAAAMRQAW